MLATSHLAPGTNLPQSIANRALIILFTGGGAEYLALALVVVTLVDAFLCYFSLLYGRKVFNSYIVHGIVIKHKNKINHLFG